MVVLGSTVLGVCCSGTSGTLGGCPLWTGGLARAEGSFEEMEMACVWGAAFEEMVACISDRMSSWWLATAACAQAQAWSMQQGVRGHREGARVAGNGHVWHVWR